MSTTEIRLEELNERFFVTMLKQQWLIQDLLDFLKEKGLQEVFDKWVKTEEGRRKEEFEKKILQERGVKV